MLTKTEIEEITKEIRNKLQVYGDITWQDSIDKKLKIVEFTLHPNTVQGLIIQTISLTEKKVADKIFEAST